MEALLRKLRPLYGQAEQHPVSAVVVMMAVIAVLGTLRLAIPEREERPLMPRHAVSQLRAMWTIWSVRLPHKRLAYKLRQKQHWLIQCCEFISHHCWIIGGTGVGKSKRIIIQMIVVLLLRRAKSAMVNDPSSELLKMSAPFLGIAGGCPLVHLLSMNPHHSDKLCSAVDVCLSRESFERFIQGGLDSLNANDRSWGESGKAMWLSVWEAEGRPDLPTSFATMNNMKRLDELAELYPETVGSHWRGSDKKGGFQDARTAALTPFAALEKSHVARLFSRGRAGNFPGPLFVELEIVYITSKDGDRSTNGVSAGLSAELMYRARNRPKGSPNVEGFFDEAGTRYPLANVADDLETVRKEGINILLAIQNVAQLRSKMGHDAADDALAGSRLQIIGATDDSQTKHYAVELAETVRVKRHSADFLERATRELSGQDVPRPETRRENRLRPEHIGNLKDGEVFISPSVGKPRIRRQRAYWTQKTYGWLVAPRKKNQMRIRLQTPDSQTGELIRTADELLEELEAREGSIQPPEPAPVPETRPPEPTADAKPTSQQDPQLQSQPMPQQATQSQTPVEDSAKDPAPSLAAEHPQGERGPQRTCRDLLEDAARRSQLEHDIQVSYAAAVVDELMRCASNPSQLPDLIQSEIFEKLEALVAAGKLANGQAVTIEVKTAGQLSIRLRSPEPRSSPSGEHTEQNPSPPDNSQQEGVGQFQTQPAPRSEPGPIPRPQQPSSRKAPTDWIPKRTCDACGQRSTIMARTCEHCGAWL